MHGLLREPLVHFAAAGVVLFAAVPLVRGPAAPAADESTIVVDRRALLTHMQYRANAFEPGTFGAALDAMSEAELDALVEDYVTEEALYREAKALGLGQSDYVIRRRMIQKLEFLLGDVAEAGSGIDDGDLTEYFAANRDAYAVAPSVTFTHVFFDAGRRGTEGAHAAAERAVRELNDAGAAFNDAPASGERFPFLKNYVERTFEYVGSHFGADFTAELSDLEAGERWQGPIRSAYGEHAVLLTRRTERRYPDLEEVRDDVVRDYRREQRDAALAEMRQAVRERYGVRIGDIAEPAGPP